MLRLHIDLKPVVYLVVMGLAGWGGWTYYKKLKAEQLERAEFDLKEKERILIEAEARQKAKLERQAKAQAEKMALAERKLKEAQEKEWLLKAEAERVEKRRLELSAAKPVEPAPVPSPVPEASPIPDIPQEPKRDFKKTARDLMAAESELAKAKSVLTATKNQLRTAEEAKATTFKKAVDECRALVKGKFGKWDLEPWVWYPQLLRLAVINVKDAAGANPNSTIVMPMDKSEMMIALKAEYDSACSAIEKWNAQLGPAQQKVDELSQLTSGLTQEKALAKEQAPPEAPSPKPAKPAQIITLKNGTKIEAVQVLKSEGVWVVKDKAGKLHTIDAAQVASQE